MPETFTEKEMRANLIQKISNLYPADSEYKSTALIGEALLRRAEQDVIQDWRDKPLGVLIRYAELCEATEWVQARDTQRGEE